MKSDLYRHSLAFLLCLFPICAHADQLSDRSNEFCKAKAKLEMDQLDNSINSDNTSSYMKQEAKKFSAYMDAVNKRGSLKDGINAAERASSSDEETARIHKMYDICIGEQQEIVDHIAKLKIIGIPDGIDDNCLESKEYYSYKSCVILNASLYIFKNNILPKVDLKTSMPMINPDKRCGMMQSNLDKAVCLKEEVTYKSYLAQIWVRTPDTVKDQCHLRDTSNTDIIRCITETVGYSWWNGDIIIPK